MKKINTSDNGLLVIKRAFLEFLLLPTIIIVLFLFLAYFTYSIDHLKISWLAQFRLFLKEHFFSNSEATSSLLGAIVSGTISITTLTTTLLLVIVQQSAGSMTTQVFDQFLRRRTNQFYFGFFVGLALYTMITLATVDAPFNPIFGATTAFFLTTTALYMLVLLMYTTINQMRPSEIINAIYERILMARTRQLKMIAFTTDETPAGSKQRSSVFCKKGGFLNSINTEHLSAFINKNYAGSQIIFNKPIGSYIAFDEEIVQIAYVDRSDLKLIEAEIRKNINISTQRDLDMDAAYGVEQLEVIAWTSISTAKSNPAPGSMCINTMSSILNCWKMEKQLSKNQHAANIFYQDNTFEELIRGFENLGVVSSESMQHQIFASILNTFTEIMVRVPSKWQDRIEKVILVLLSVMGDHALTTALENALLKLIAQLKIVNKTTTAAMVDTALQQLRNSVGKLNSRSTRV